jgi:protein gp37
MAEASSIEWTDATWNIVTGCQVVSPGCTNCYAMKLAGTRLQHHASRAGLTSPSKAGPVWNGQVRFNAGWLTQPLRWKRPRKIFVCAHGDLFADGVEDAWLDQVFAVMALAPQHTFQVLTKRPARMRAYLSDAETKHRVGVEVIKLGPPIGVDVRKYPGQVIWDAHGTGQIHAVWPLPNVWAGVSTEDQDRADERIPELLRTPVAVRFISVEPFLSAIDLTDVANDGDSYFDVLRGHTAEESIDGEAVPGLDWVIVGGESGPGARPMHPAWARKIRDDCDAASVPFFFKQWGGWAPVCAMSEEQVDAAYHPRPARRPEASRRCKVATHVLHDDASRHGTVEPLAYIGGVGAMLMMEIGKHAAGRLLDGAEHNWMPGQGLG